MRIISKSNPKDGKNTYYVKTPFRRCTVEDYTSRGVARDAPEMNSYVKRFCPDIDKIEDYLQIKNGYNNKDERISFSVEIVKCNDTPSVTCRNDATEAILEQVYFTLYNLEEIIDFKNPDKLKSRPIRTEVKFHSQF